jgi:Flp pilus assembly protein TadG
MDDTRAPGEFRRGASRRRGRGDKGAALVEFAIIAPLVFALLLGMFTGGLAMSRKNSMTSAVREGARFGATLTESATWADDTRSRALALSPDDLSTTQVCVRLVKAPSTVRRTSTGCTAAMIAAAPSVTGITAGDCAVLVWARRSSKLEFVFGSQDLTLDAQSVSRFERDCA